jgi:hypothetical protein
MVVPFPLGLIRGLIHSVSPDVRLVEWWAPKWPFRAATVELDRISM